MNFIGQKVSVKDKTSYDGTFVPGGNGIIIEENRCSQTGSLNGVYVMFSGVERGGHVSHVPLQELIFLNPKSLEESGKNDLMDVLSVILQKSSPTLLA
jgi:hypothetical protein|tara:strand:- start:724 stop:1017 length:294 start_codon:yes stop_codon:yes gene_type:complete